MERLTQRLSGREALIALLSQREAKIFAAGIDLEGRARLAESKDKDIEWSIILSRAKKLPHQLELVKSVQKNDALHHLACVGFLSEVTSALEKLEAAAYSVLNSKKKKYQETEVNELASALRTTVEAYDGYFTHLQEKAYKEDSE